MKLLALDTATLEASVAICDDLKPLAQVQREVSTHSDHLLSLVDEALKAASLEIGAIDAIICGAGPGSFTGVRIGLATAKGLCFAAGKPLVMASSLGALGTLGMQDVESSGMVLAVVDARKGEVFSGLYRCGKLVREEAVSSPDRLLEVTGLTGDEDAEILMLGSGVERYEALFRNLLPKARVGEDHRIQARYLVREGLDRAKAGEFSDLANAVPNYVRGPDIRPPKAPTAS